jgi:stage IV sporulation protein FB
MTDYISWCPINLGRWCGTQVRVHVLFVAFVPVTLLAAVFAKGRPVAETAGWLALLVLVVILHELGHVAMATWLGSDLDDVRLWPLGSIPNPTVSVMTPWTETVLVAAAGPITSFILAAVSLIGLQLADVSMVTWPFGNAEGTGAPILASGKLAAPLSVVWWVGWFGFLNWVVCLTNLIPALPMDGGRILRAVLGSPAINVPRERTVVVHTAWGVVFLLVIAGMTIVFFSKQAQGGMTLILLAFLVYLMVRAEARGFDEGGFYDEGVFGYDFSEGYTSLEGSARKVRPFRESALRRWRRRRSDQRLQRRQAREAAEEQRMDEILAKLHTHGRSALTDEEQRFLIRVSAKYRGRSKARE